MQERFRSELEWDAKRVFPDNTPNFRVGQAVFVAVSYADVFGFYIALFLFEYGIPHDEYTDAAFGIINRLLVDGAESVPAIEQVCIRAFQEDFPIQAAGIGPAAYLAMAVDIHRGISERSQALQSPQS
jgi:hypothetical protein